MAECSLSAFLDSPVPSCGQRRLIRLHTYQVVRFLSLRLKWFYDRDVETSGAAYLIACKKGSRVTVFCNILPEHAQFACLPLKT